MVFSAPPNCCKRLTKRRLFARRPSGRLEQSALRGGALSARPFSKRRTKRAAVSVAVFSRFAIYANVVRCATFYTRGDAALSRSSCLLWLPLEINERENGMCGEQRQSANTLPYARVKPALC